MTDKCTKCGRAEPQIIADAKTLCLLQELENGVYTCCQVSQWADEQWLAWFKATQEDQDVTIRPEFSEAELVLVSVRLRRQQVPGAERLTISAGTGGDIHAWERKKREPIAFL